MKKLFNYFLIFSIVFATIGLHSSFNVLAVAASTLKTELTPTKEQQIYSESFELNGVQYFYEDTEKYTITITKSADGEETIAYKNKLVNNDEIYIKTTLGITTTQSASTVAQEMGSEMKPLKPFDAKKFEILKEKVINNELLLEKRSINEFADITDISKNTELGTLVTTPISKINYSLTQTYGAQYTNKYLTSLTKSGYTGYLYQHMTFGATPKTSFAFNAATAIGIVATAVGTPLTGLIGIAAWTSTAAGAYTLLKPTNFDTWNAKVYIQKEVKVGSIYPYRAFYDRGLQAVTGSQGYAALSEVRSTYKSSDFDSNSSLLNTGINNYIMIN